MCIFNFSKNPYCFAKCVYQFILSIPEDESPNVPYTNNQYSHFSGGFVVLAPVCIFLNAHEIEQIFVGLLDTGCFPL